MTVVQFEMNWLSPMTWFSEGASTNGYQTDIVLWYTKKHRGGRI